MKREFGKKLIEEYFAGRRGSPGVDLTHVIDASGAYIPGHGTPTVILFGRNRAPIAKTIRAVMGIRGEPSAPVDPARGLVWSAILAQVDQPRSQSEFLSVADSPRELFHKHPWAIGGGGAAELKERLEAHASFSLGDLTSSIGVMVVTAEDDAFASDAQTLNRYGVGPRHQIGFVEGDTVRDWTLQGVPTAIFPYSKLTLEPELTASVGRRLWTLRTALCRRLMFKKTQLDRGLRWFEYGMFIRGKYRTPFSITFGSVATHNHFVLDRGGKVFKQSAPVIKLPDEVGESDHLTLLALLNSSVTCFWMKQVMFAKSSQRAVGGHRDRPEQVHFDFAATALAMFPIPCALAASELITLCRIAKEINVLATRLISSLPHMVLKCGRDLSSQSLRHALAEQSAVHGATHRRMIALQEELDWEIYHIFGLSSEGASNRVLDDVNEGITSDARPFAWTSDSSPNSVPAGWREVYSARRQQLCCNRDVSLMEALLYKRPWFGRQGVYGRLAKDYSERTADALEEWLLDRLESYLDFDGRMNDESKPTAKLDVALTSVARLTDVARQDPDFMRVGELFRNDPAFDVEWLVAGLVDAECVPLLPVLRYKATGLRKRAEWEQTWGLQRQEDANAAEVKCLLKGSGLPTEDDAEVPTRLAPWPALESFCRVDAFELQDRLSDKPDPNVRALCQIVNEAILGRIPVPPKYTSADFLKGDYWRLRGKLDVPKERWVSFPHCEGSDGTLVIAWAGYDHLQLGKAISTYYVDIQERLGGRDDPRLVPLLACLLELLPWLKQWHNEPDAAFNGTRMGDYFEGFIQEEARQLGKTIPEIKAWQPPKKAGKKAKAGSRQGDLQ
jgi:hypothetical protein